MVPRAQPFAMQLGTALAEAARREPTVEELWVSAQLDGVHLWLVTASIDMATERSLHRLAGLLYDRFQTADFQLHILNPRHYGGDARRALPHQAEQIPLR
jgi:hypothetical protein